MQSTRSAEITTEPSVNECGGKQFKCLNATHYQTCISTERLGAVPLVTLSEQVEACLEGRACDEKGLESCAAQLLQADANSTATKSTATEVKKTRKRIRLIKGKKASNWRPRFNLNSEAQRKAAETLRDRLIKQRRKQEQFLDSFVAKQSSNKNKNQNQNKNKNKNKNQSNKNKNQVQKQNTNQSPPQIPSISRPQKVTAQKQDSTDYDGK